MGQPIFNIQHIGDAIRNTGYKNIENAVSEIIDNSIEAEASQIFILVSQKLNGNTGKNNVAEIAFLDNGKGMDTSVLESCLTIGSSTRTERRGMGRFGVGLPQASLYASKSVDVYSWRDGYENCKKVGLDSEKMKSGEQTDIGAPIADKIPSKYSKYLKYQTSLEKIYDFEKKGTFVYWKNCDRVIPKTIFSLFNRLSFTLGQKFRYFIRDGSCEILLVNSDNGEVQKILPNDPLLLMNPNYALGNPKCPEKTFTNNGEGLESFFEPYVTDKYPSGEIDIPVKYLKNDQELESVVKVKFSKIKKVFYDQDAFPGAKNPGHSPMGRHAAKLEGISIVRANREIDFGKFDFYKNTYSPENRWWGCEISFDPVLDEAFGVANNKQFVALREVNEEDYDPNTVKDIWLQLYNIINSTISKMLKDNKNLRKSARTTESQNLNSTRNDVINKVENNNPDYEDSQSEEIKNQKTPEELRTITVQILKEDGIEDPDDGDIDAFLKNKVDIKYTDVGRRQPFLDYTTEYGNVRITLNTGHDFYENFLSKIMTETDSKEIFELFIASFFTTLNETNRRQMAQNDELLTRWNNKLWAYMNELNNFGN